jgi:HlyD family secretion protein
MPWKKILQISLAVAALALVAWILRAKPLQVDGATVKEGPMQITLNEQGETRTYNRFVLSAPVAGRLARISLRDGDAVAANQVLAEISPLPLSRREINETHGRIAAAQASQREAEQSIQRTEASVVEAKREHERLLKLVREGFVSGQAVDHASSTLDASVHEAQAARSRAEVAKALVKVAKSALTTTDHDEANTSTPLLVRAPTSAKILSIPDPSERVVAAGTTLMVLGDMRQLEVVIQMLSVDAIKVEAGMPALVEGWGGDTTLRAKVVSVEPHAATKISALGIEERRVNVHLALADAPRTLGDGFGVTAKIIVWQTEKTLKVPASALFRCNAEWCVFTAEDGIARRRAVQINHRNLTEAEVTGGLTVGQTVVIYPGNALADGMKIDPQLR